MSEFPYLSQESKDFINVILTDANNSHIFDFDVTFGELDLTYKLSVN